MRRSLSALHHHHHRRHFDHLQTHSVAAAAPSDRHNDDRPSTTMVIVSPLPFPLNWKSEKKPPLSLQRSTPPPFSSAADGGAAPREQQQRVGVMRSTSREARYTIVLSLSLFFASSCPFHFGLGQCPHDDQVRCSFTPFSVALVR